MDAQRELSDAATPVDVPADAHPLFRPLTAAELAESRHQRLVPTADTRGAAENSRS